MARKNPYANVTLQFYPVSREEDRAYDAADRQDQRVVLELDREYIEAVYGYTKSSFGVGETAYFRLFYFGDDTLSYHSSAGSLSVASSNIKYAYEENVTFAMSRFGSLRHRPADNNVAWQWLGEDGGTPVFDGRVIKLFNAVVGVLKCSYPVNGKRLALSVGSAALGEEDEISVIVLAEAGEQTGYATVRYHKNVEDAEEADETELDREPRGSLSLSLDGEYNTKIYGQNRTTFAPGESAYLRLVSSMAESVQKHTSAGSLSVHSSNVPSAQSEEITFAMSDTGQLRQKPEGGVAYSWQGNNGGTPVFDGRQIKLPEPVVAVLKCDYSVKGSRLRLNVSDANMSGMTNLSVVVVAVAGEQKASVTVRYSKDDVVSTDPIAMDLQVSDFCSGDSVGDVRVYLNGENIGVTNEAGIIHLGELLPGSTHQLRMTRDGYIDSDNDVLHNDSFTVPSE